jgi:hypothetical protein
VINARDDLEAALDFARRGTQKAREERATDPELVIHLTYCLRVEARILDSVGRLDEAVALDAEWTAFNPGRHAIEMDMRRAKKHMAVGEDAQAEPILTKWLYDMRMWPEVHRSKILEVNLSPHTLLAELLERRGTEEALAQARTLRDGVAQRLAEHEAKRVAALEETRAAAAEAVRQWRKESIKAKEKKGGKGKGKGKKKSKKKGGRAKSKGQGASSAAAIEGGPRREPAGGHAMGAAAMEGAAAAEEEEQAPAGESQPPDEEEEKEGEAREECAVCLQDLLAEDDEDPWCDEGGEGEALVVSRCGHRFHEICGDMWCAKCADKGWGVTCPRCRAVPGST